ncbi:MAG: acyl-phosphate glycerol 3-phosphate acyltransferase [Acidobacteria bacterium]|nr:acyl-phosphate glycerol 3-phosphate acyltransferase [Acidobacteriota bacterium]
MGIVVIVAAYLLGSIPFGYLIVRLTAGADVRDTGSGGTGATNVSRRAGRVAGILTLLLDAAKGAAAVVLASWLLHTDYAISGPLACASVAVIAGHCFPIWLGFRGGKGVATGVGVFLMLAPWALLGAGIIFLLVVWSTRYVSLGSIIATAAFPLLVALLHFFVKPVPGFRYTLLASLAGGTLIIFMHRGNIERLLNGTENKLK